MGRRVAKTKRGIVGQRSIDAHKVCELIGFEGGEDGLEALEALGMARRGDVLEAVAVGDQGRIHLQTLGNRPTRFKVFRRVRGLNRCIQSVQNPYRTRTYNSARRRLPGGAIHVLRGSWQQAGHPSPAAALRRVPLDPPALQHLLGVYGRVADGH